MPKNPQPDPEAKLWEVRRKLADKHYHDWLNRFDVDRLQDYYEGKQFKGVDPLSPDAPYVVNKVLTTVEAQKPTMLSDTPRHRVIPVPGLRDDLSEFDPRVELMERTIDTLVRRRDMHYMDHVTQAFHNSFFGPGILQVGYSNTFDKNPNAGKPIMVPGEDGSDVPKRDPETNEVMVEPPEIAVEEQLFFKCIPFKTFRVNHNSTYILENNDWCGYWEVFRVSDMLERFPEITARRELLEDYVPDEMKAYGRESVDKIGAECKAWRIWDLNAGLEVMVSGGLMLESRPFSVFPLADLRYLPWKQHWWPLPPTYNWISPQRAINYARNLLIRHVRQGIARYIGHKRAFNPEELERTLRSDDVEIAWTEEEIEDLSQAIQLIPQPSLGLDFHRGLNVMDDDFIESSGVGGEQRGLAEAGTATQASILDARAQSREEGSREKLRTTLGKLGRAALLTIRENFGLDMVIRINVDPSRADAEAKLQEVFQTVNAIDQFPSVDFEVQVDLISQNPASKQLERSAWGQVLQLLSVPGVAAALSQSPLLLKKTLDQFDIVSEQEISEVQKALAAAVQAQQQPPAAEGGGGPQGLVEQFIQQGGAA
ncbi:MAG: hypothetical protein ACE5JX_14660 [Acidobacteriota bacterium]